MKLLFAMLIAFSLLASGCHRHHFEPIPGHGDKHHDKHHDKHDDKHHN